MQLDQWIQIGLPVSLALIMFSMGLALHTDDFVQIVKRPKTLLVGLAAQMLLVPLLSLALISAIPMPAELAVGFLILSFCPGGTTSNLFSWWARGDLALSVALTAVTSVITPFTIPWLSQWAIAAQLQETHAIEIAVLPTMLRLFAVAIVPLLLGMAVTFYLPKVSLKIQKAFNRFSSLLFLTVIVFIIVEQWQILSENVLNIGLSILLLIVTAMIAGRQLSIFANLGHAQSKTITLETGLQNGGMALLVTQHVLDNSFMSLVPVLYGLLMLLPAALFTVLVRYERLN